MYFTDKDSPMYVSHKDKPEFGEGRIVRLTENFEAYVEWENVSTPVFALHDLSELTKLGYTESDSDENNLTIETVVQYITEHVGDKHLNNDEILELIEELIAEFSELDDEEENEVEEETNEEVITQETNAIENEIQPIVN